MLLLQKLQSFPLFPLPIEVPEPDLLLLVGQDVPGVHADREASVVAAFLAMWLRILAQAAAAIYKNKLKGAGSRRSSRVVIGTAES